MANTKKKKLNRKGKVVFVVASILCICILTGLAVAGYVVIDVIKTANGDPIIDLEDYKENQGQTSFIYYYEDNDPAKPVEWMRLHAEENRIWVNINDISPNMVTAFVGLEDKRFYSHNGVDWIRTMGTAKYGFSQGGSTITQQLVKNITNEKEVTFVRKFNEIETALNMEKNYNKNTILEAYLNTVYLGSGCYGVKTAAETYFGKDIKDINLAEACCIASITKAPYGYNPLYNPDANKERREYCLKSLYEQGTITLAEYQDALNYHLIFTNSPDYVPSEEMQERSEKEDKQETAWSWYVDYLLNCVIDDLQEEYGYNERQASSEIYYGGLKIYAAVDMDIQKQLEYCYKNYIAFDNDEVQSAMTIMNYSGRVVAIVGGAGEKTENRSLVRASDSPRPPGSTIKPIACYSPLLDLKQITFSSKEKDYAFARNGSMWPHNVDKTLGTGGNVTMQVAVAESKNTVPARLIRDKLSVETSFDYLKNHFMLGHLDNTKDKDLGPLTLGSLTNGATTVEMASAYASFGNGGKYYKPYAYYKVTNSSGTKTILDNTEPSWSQAISPEASDIMCELLQTVPTSYYGDCEVLRKFPIMAKTGTTSDDKDRWFCAGTPHYVGAVWYGYDIPRTLNASINPAGKIFFNVFNRIHRGLNSDVAFPKTAKTIEKSYCTVTGKLAGSGCYSTAKGWYDTSNLPDTCTYCSGSHSSSDGESSRKKAVDDVVDAAVDIIDYILE